MFNLPFPITTERQLNTRKGDLPFPLPFPVGGNLTGPNTNGV